MSERCLIVGLGNPGKDYEYTRHNLGFLVVRHIVDAKRFNFSLSSFTKGITANGVVDEREASFLLPTTFMNNSGIV